MQTGFAMICLKTSEAGDNVTELRLSAKDNLHLHLPGF